MRIAGHEDSIETSIVTEEGTEIEVTRFVCSCGIVGHWFEVPEMAYNEGTAHLRNVEWDRSHR